METFVIEIKETLSRKISVLADTAEGAIDWVTEQYYNEKIVLDSSDYSGLHSIEEVEDDHG